MAPSENKISDCKHDEYRKLAQKEYRNTYARVGTDID